MRTGEPPRALMLIRYIPVALILLTIPAIDAQTPPGKAEYEAFAVWRKSNPSFAGDWGKALAQYRLVLEKRGATGAGIDRAVQAINAYGEAELYDSVYAADAPGFSTEPNQLLVQAIRGRTPGDALDAAMGQGRNAVYLAAQGWKVTGFDVSAVGLQRAQGLAKSRRVNIRTVHSSDDDFDFGKSRWDLIALIYLIEKRSVHRVREALRPGGIVVIEAGHKTASNAPFEYESGELLRLFEGFRILHYDEPTGPSDWGKEPHRKVRFVAEKPR